MSPTLCFVTMGQYASTTWLRASSLNLMISSAGLLRVQAVSAQHVIAHEQDIRAQRANRTDGRNTPLACRDQVRAERCATQGQEPRHAQGQLMNYMHTTSGVEDLSTLLSWPSLATEQQLWTTTIRSAPHQQHTSSTRPEGHRVGRQCEALRCCAMQASTHTSYFMASHLTR